MAEWFETAGDFVWLPPDEVGGDEAARIAAMLGLRAGDRVLDAPCGAGRVSVHLARMGCRVSGVDLRPQFVARAEARFAAEGQAGDFRAMDLRTFDDCGQYDAIMNWWGSFGYFAEAENADLVRRFVRALRPDGRLVIEQTNRERILRHFLPVLETRTMVNYNQWEAATERCFSEWHQRAEDGGQVATSSIRLYTPAQFRGLFEQAGLTWVGAFDSTDGGPYRRGSRRIAAVGRKD